MIQGFGFGKVRRGEESGRLEVVRRVLASGRGGIPYPARMTNPPFP